MHGDRRIGIDQVMDIDTKYFIHVTEFPTQCIFYYMLYVHQLLLITILNDVKITHDDVMIRTSKTIFLMHGIIFECNKNIVEKNMYDRTSRYLMRQCRKLYSIINNNNNT